LTSAKVQKQDAILISNHFNHKEGGLLLNMTVISRTHLI
jgi:hypothetical protein